MRKKDNISTYIKDELNRRELTPSHDAWNRIQARMDVAPDKKGSNYKWWLSAAVVFIFIFSTIIYLLVNKDNNEFSQASFVKNEITKDTASQELNKIDDTLNTLAVNEKNRVENISELNHNNQTKESNTEIAKVKETKDTVTNSKNELKTVIEQKKTLVATNKLDSIKKLKKENNYVDPDMLLYSIENKENIKETEKSRVVSVDINKK